MNCFSERISRMTASLAALFLIFSMAVTEAGAQPGKWELSIKKGTVAAKGLVMAGEGSDKKPVWVMYDEGGDVVYVIGPAAGDLENAKVMAGSIYNAHVRAFEDVRSEYGDDIIQYPVMSRDDYESTSSFPSADGSFSLDRPVPRPGTQSVVIRKQTARFEKSGLVLHESPLALNSTDQEINSGDVLLKKNGEIMCSTQKPPDGAEGTPARIGYYAAFYTHWTALPGEPGKYNTDGRESLMNYNHRSPDDRLWGPVAHAKIGFWGYFGTSTDEKGFFRFFHPIPLSVGQIGSFWNILMAQLRYEPFDPVTSSAGTYYVMHPVRSHYHSSGLHDLVPGDSIAGVLNKTGMMEEESEIAGEADIMYNFSVDVSVLAGEATMRNDTPYRNPPVPMSPPTPPGPVPFPGNETETEYVYDATDFGSGQPADLNLMTDLDGNRTKDTAVYDSAGNVISVWLGDSGPPAEPDVTRVPYRGPDIADQGLLKTVSRTDLNDTDIYVYRISGDQRIAVRKGINPDKGGYYHGTTVSEEDGGILVSYHMLMRGPLSFRTYRNSAATFDQWQSQTRFAKLPNPESEYMRAGERLKVIMINRATGYIGTAVADVSLTKYDPSGDGVAAQTAEIPGGTTLISFTTGERTVMRPPNLKIRAEREYKVQRGLTAGTDREHMIGSEGSGLTSDTYIKITTEWYDHDGSPLPENLEGYTGRLARVVDANMKLGQPMISNFAVRPGRNTQVVEIPAGGDNYKAHYYIHVSGRTAGADFSTTGAGEGALQYRPRHYVPFKVPIFDEAATLEAEMTRRNAMAQGTENVREAEPVYQWVYRPEMQFSLFDFDVQKIERADDRGIPALVMSDSAEVHLLESADRDISIIYALSQDIVPILPQFGPPREYLVFSLGGQEARAFFNPSGPVILENTDHISLLEPENYIAIRFYQNGDDPNVLWEYAFGDADLDIWVPEVIAGESPVRIPDSDEMSRGSVTFVNLDNDDNDSFFDTDDSSVSGGDDELVRLELKVQPPTLADKNVRLTAVSGGDCVRIWKSADKSAGEYNLGEPLTLAEKGNFLAADLWAEGIKAHSSQRQTVLRLNYPLYNPDYTDEVALTVIGVSRLKWIGRKNCHTPGSSQHDSDEPDSDDPNFPQGVLMGSDSAEILKSRRIFSGARAPDFSDPRDETWLEAELTVSPPRKLDIFVRAFDADDPSSETEMIDPNDSGQGQGTYSGTSLTYDDDNDNRGEVGGRKQGILGQASDDSAAKRITFFPGEIRKRLNFRVSHHPGDNYRAVANGDEDFVGNLRNRDKDDGFRIVDPHVGGDADARQVRQADRYTSHVLTVWRILHVESDSMEAVPTDETHPERNFVTGVIEEVRKDGKEVELSTDLRTLPNGLDFSANLSSSSAKGRFENGTIRIGEGAGAETRVDGNGSDFVLQDEGFDIPFKISGGAEGQIVKFDRSSQSFTLAVENGETLSEDDRGQTINIAGVEMTVSDVAAANNTVRADPLLSIPFRLTDDDHGPDSLPYNVNLSGLDAYEKAYLLWENDGGGGDNNSDDVPFKLNAQNAPSVYLISIYKHGSEFNETTAFWVVYICTAWQYRQLLDFDPNSEVSSYVGSVEIEAELHNVNLARGAHGCLIFRETILDATDNASVPPTIEIYTLAHEVGHQFGLGHGDTSNPGGKIAEFPNMGLMHPGGKSPVNPGELIARHINLIRSRVWSPGRGE